MSAFSALQNKEEIFYAKNSSDEGSDSNSELENEVPVTSVDVSSENLTPFVAPQVDSFSNYSKFTISTDSNTAFTEDGVYFCLDINESLVLKGTFKLTVLKGCAQIGGIDYEAKKSNTPLEVIALPTHSVPEVICKETTRKSAVKSLGNAQQYLNRVMLTKPTLIKVLNWDTKLSEIANLAPIFKSLFLKSNSDFLQYTFEPVFFGDLSVNVLKISDQWRAVIDKIVYQSYKITTPKILIIGYKNSGKSTFLKELKNNYLKKCNYNDPVAILDLDPGQNEFSLTNSISYSTHSAPSLSSLHLQDAKDLFANEYYGSSNPMDHPEYYIRLIKRLYKSNYVQGDFNRQVPLLINTPGWVKGYGIELIGKIVQITRPTDIIYLCNESTDDEMMDVLSNYDTEVHKVTGVSMSYDNFKCSAQDLTTFKLLAHFHRGKEYFTFSPLLTNPPLRISYLTSASSAGQVYQGISAFALVNDSLLDLDEGIDADNISIMLDCSIVGIYAVDAVELCNVLEKTQVVQDNAPKMIKFSDFEEIYEENGNFLALAMIHSVDMKSECFNVYLNDLDLDIVKSHMESNQDQRVMLVKGTTHVPIWEIYPKLNGKGKLFAKDKVPFLSMNDKFGKGGKTLKIRRNIKRRQ